MNGVNEAAENPSKKRYQMYQNDYRQHYHSQNPMPKLGLTPRYLKREDIEGWTSDISNHYYHSMNEKCSEFIMNRKQVRVRKEMDVGQSALFYVRLDEEATIVETNSYTEWILGMEEKQSVQMESYIVTQLDREKLQRGMEMLKELSLLITEEQRKKYHGKMLNVNYKGNKNIKLWKKKLLMNLDLELEVTRDEVTVEETEEGMKEEQPIFVSDQNAEAIFFMKLSYDMESREYQITGIETPASMCFERRDYRMKSLMLDQIEKSIIFTNMEGEIVYWNKYAEQLYGYTSEETLGEKILLMMTWDLNSEKATEIMCMMSEGKTWEGTFHCRRKDGTSIAVQCMNSPIQDENGQMMGIVGISSDNMKFEEAMLRLQEMKDTLEEKVKERTLELEAANAELLKEVNDRRKYQDETKLLTLVAIKTNSGVAILNSECQVTWINSALAKQIPGDYPRDFRQWIEGYPEVGQLIQDRKDFVYSIHVLKNHWYTLDGTVIQTEEGFNYVILFHDINKQKRIEEEYIKADRLKTEFITTMSHELRTPLNGIMGTTSLLMSRLQESTIDKDSFIEHLGIIMSSSRILLTLVNNVLDFQKCTMDKMQYNPAPFSLFSSALSSLFACIPIAKVYDVTLQFCVGGYITSYTKASSPTPYDDSSSWLDISTLNSVAISSSELHCDTLLTFDHSTMNSASSSLFPTSFYGEKDKLIQICINLLGNAIKFSPKGKTVRFDLQTAFTPLPYLVITVADQGRGISKEDRSKLFQPFSQLHNHNLSGSGLGLSICKRLLNIMNGNLFLHDMASSSIEVTLQSLCSPLPLHSFQGAIFYAYIPVLQNSPPSSPLLSSSPLKKRPKFAALRKIPSSLDSLSLHLLIVEDNLINLKILSSMVNQLLKPSHQKYTISTAANGVECLQSLQSHSFHLIFMDIQMPLMDGLEATRQIVSRYPSPSSRPVIVALTANARSADEEKALEVGMDYFLSKPVTIDKIKFILSEVGIKLNSMK